MAKPLTPWGKKCKMQMIALEKSLTELSKETGYSRTYLSAIINGRLAAPEETTDKISHYLKVDPSLYSVS